jgi:penicillin-insensitive murein endopeptidase
MTSRVHIARLVHACLLGIALAIFAPAFVSEASAQTRTASASSPTQRRGGRRTRTHRRRRASATPRPVEATSVGRATRGALVGGVALQSSEHLAVKSSSQGQNFGTPELVALLGRVSLQVAERSPGSRMQVGDLSREGGGRFGPHRSHRSGRDADVGFYLLDAEGNPTQPPRFHDIGRDGIARQDASVHLDEVRTWQLIEALVTETETPVQFIFVAAHIKARLLEEGRRQGASEETLAHAAAVVQEERAHTNHLHVRIYCPISDIPRCDEEPPYHPWIDRQAAREAAALAHAEEQRQATIAARTRRRRGTTGSASTRRRAGTRGGRR